MLIIFCDIVGVLHDNYKIYSGVTETLLNLKKRGAKVVLLSNTPRRAFKAQEMLKTLGITEELYTEIVTSGEVFYQNIMKTLPKVRAFFLGFEKDLDYATGTNIHLEYNNCESCDFTIISGFKNKGDKLETVINDLERMKKMNLKSYCINPDLHVVKQNGDIDLYCAGTIAKYYEEMGGIVEYFGKPCQNIYNYAMKIANIDNKDSIVAIGDAMNTDIKGANNFGIKSILVNSGLHKNDSNLSNFSFQPNYKVERFSQILGII